jgi:hypothetical protein
MRPIISFFAFAVFALGVVTACNSAEWKGAQTTPPPLVPSRAQPPTVQADGVRRVTVTELQDLLAKNEAIVLDVRNQASYDMGHIRGSRLIPEAEVVSHIDELPRNKLIVTYCS